MTDSHWRTAAALGAVIASYGLVRAGRNAPIDTPVTAAMGQLHTPAVDQTVASVTDLGSVYGLAGVAAAIGFTGRWRLASNVSVSGLLAWSLAQASKPALNRQRPYELSTARRLVAEPAGSSWPSGHAAVAAAMCETLRPHLDTKGRRGSVLATVAIGLSRLHVGVHHFTDVAAGWGMGTLAARIWCGRFRRCR